MATRLEISITLDSELMNDARRIGEALGEIEEKLVGLYGEHRVIAEDVRQAHSTIQDVNGFEVGAWKITSDEDTPERSTVREVLGEYAEAELADAEREAFYRNAGQWVDLMSEIAKRAREEAYVDIER